MVNVRDGFQSWQEYYYDNITESDYMYALNLISKMNEDIQIISNELNIPITYYEDLFDIGSEERLRKYSTKEVKKKKMI
jgi:Mg2+ and Co2+ transporter CorA